MIYCTNVTTITKFREEDVKNEVEKVTFVRNLCQATASSNYSKVENMLAQISNKSFSISEILNSNSYVNRSVVHECVTSTYNYDESNPTKCDNYKIFKLLMEQPNGLKMDFVNHMGYNVWHSVSCSNKVKFLGICFILFMCFYMKYF